jgi:RNA polymerase sigma-70 factor (ECF subfamily)
MAALARDEQGAIGLLYDRYGTVTYALAYRILRDRGEAEEVVQDVFLQAWRRATSFDPGRGSARTWLMTLTHHRAIDRLRGKTGRARQAFSLDEIELPTYPRDDPWDAVVWRMLREQLRSAFVQLPSAQRQVVSWAYFDGYSTREIAEHLDVPLGTIKGRLRLGLRALREELGQLVGAHAGAGLRYLTGSADQVSPNKAPGGQTREIE